MNPRKKVLVAMSGGVDSSVAAALLKQRGFFVMGGFMKNFSQEGWAGIVSSECPWEKDWEDVQRVCEKLGIEARAFNFEREYADRVIDYFFREYEAGLTPNPDVMCNKEIKFKLFLEKALDLGYDYIATGHYARIRPHPQPLSRPGEGGRRPGEVECELLKGLDPNKDQSYFLYALDQKQLAKSLFPIGEYRKAEVRELAREFGLPNAEKKDSQGICFVGEVNLIEFLKQRIPVRVGEIVTTDGQVVGRHENAAYYTVGQRHGFGIGGIGPFYMVDKDLSANRVLVTNQHNDPKLYSNSLIVKNMHWINPETENRLPFKATAQHRYRQQEQSCKIEKPDSAYRVTFDSPQRAITPGQSVVLYDNEVILGGGVIENSNI